MLLAGILAALVSVALLTGLIIALKRRRLPTVMKYGDLRKQAFAAAGRMRPRGEPRSRPGDLDMRLPAALVAQLRTLYPPTKDTHSAFFDCYLAIVQSISEELNAIDRQVPWYELLTPGRRAVILVEAVEAEVNNGGFDQYYLNTSGDGAALAPAALRLLGREDAASIIERANAQFQGGPPADRGQRLKAMDRLAEPVRKVWYELDGEWYKLKSENGVAIDAAVPYMLAHEGEFFRAE